MIRARRFDESSPSSNLFEKEHAEIAPLNQDLREFVGTFRRAARQKKQPLGAWCETDCSMGDNW
jgi:hypothetical protein